MTVDQQTRRLWVAQAQLAPVLRRALDQRQLSQRWLADAAGLDPKMVRKVLGARTSPWVRLETAEKLLAAVGSELSVHDLDVVCAA